MEVSDVGGGHSVQWTVCCPSWPRDHRLCRLDVCSDLKIQIEIISFLKIGFSTQELIFSTDRHRYLNLPFWICLIWGWRKFEFFLIKKCKAEIVAVILFYWQCSLFENFIAIIMHLQYCLKYSRHKSATWSAVSSGTFHRNKFNSIFHNSFMMTLP